MSDLSHGNMAHGDLAHADLRPLRIATHGDRAFLAWLVAAVLLGISALGFYMWQRANSGGNDAPFLAAVQHK